MSEGKQQGWLWKQGGKVKTWKYRFFVLHFTYMEYFETDKVTSIFLIFSLIIIIILLTIITLKYYLPVSRYIRFIFNKH